MRTRKLIAGVLLAVVAGFSLGGVAAAQGNPKGPKDDFAKECIEILEGGGSADDCQEAPSPIAPATNELLWGIASFAVLFVLLWKLAWPGIKKGMEGRTERIRSSLEEAEHAKAEAERVLDEYRRQLAEARSEAGRVIEESRQQADALRRDLQAKAEADIAELRERAAADVEAAKTAAIADLREQVSQIAIGAAELVVQRSLDRDTQMQLIENYINQVMAGSGK
jgi:F-type H+-transporting ATPase subunit b